MIIDNNNFCKDYLEAINEILVSIFQTPVKNLEEITKCILGYKSELLGRLALCMIQKKFDEELEQEYYDCPCCKKKLRRKPELVKKVLETMIGKIEFERPYFYCKNCKKGYYPLDEKMGLAEGKIQYDVKELEAWLSSKHPYEEAHEVYEKCTANKLSQGHMFDTTNEVAKNLNILDVCPTAEEIHQKIEEYSEGKFRRPIIMIAVDGAHAPTRPEPSPYRGKRGKGEWQEVKGFRIYLLDSKRITHLISWHQICCDKELAQALKIIKEAGLIPEKKVRMCFIADGARWIWSQISTIFPTAKQVLDFYHCSEYIHDVANAQYGKSSQKAREWVEASFTRLFHDQVDSVIWGLQRMQPTSDDAKKQILDTIRYLNNNANRVNYRAAKIAGYHIGSGAIESANKFIGHVRLKRSGAWWYSTHANNILKLRCASYNKTFDKVMEKFKIYDQARIRKKNLAA